MILVKKNTRIFLKIPGLSRTLQTPGLSSTCGHPVNAYTYDFDIYTGQGKEPIGENGLGYVVMNFGTPLRHQGYHFYFDTFYTSKFVIFTSQVKGRA